MNPLDSASLLGRSFFEQIRPVFFTVLAVFLFALFAWRAVVATLSLLPPSDRFNLRAAILALVLLVMAFWTLTCAQ